MEKNERAMYQELRSAVQMESGGRCHSPRRQCDARRVDETELGELGRGDNGNTIVTMPEITPTVQMTKTSQGIACYDGACKTQMPSRSRPMHRLESPWHHLKTVFLVSIIISFIVWLVAYIVLAQYGVV